MTPGIGLALLAMVCFGAGDLVYKRAAAAGIEARHFIMLQAWFFCPLVTIYALARQQLVLAPAALWGSLAGLVMFFAFYNFSRSLRTGSISAKLIGLGFALIAVVALAGESSGQTRTATSIGSLTRVLLATVAAGIGNLLYKIGLLAGSPPETLLSTQAWVFCSLATAFVWFTDGRVKPPRAGFRYGAMVGVTLLGGFIALLHGLAVGPASVLIPVAQLGFVFTAVLGRVLFAEPLSWRKRGGLAIAAAAMITLAFS
jgi:drug/metabolite transporter (DMT)-like permease